jgi:hypothetical protein
MPANISTNHILNIYVWLQLNTQHKQHTQGKFSTIFGQHNCAHAWFLTITGRTGNRTLINLPIEGKTSSVFPDKATFVAAFFSIHTTRLSKTSNAVPARGAV